MKAALITRYGGPEAFEYGEAPEPRPKANEVLVRVAAAGLNPVDAMDRAGGTKDWRHLEFPAIIGWDVAGTVEAIGSDVHDLSVGDRVMGWAFATYAEKVAVAADLLVKVPRGLETADAAALPLAGITGSQLISIGSGVQPGQSVLVSGAIGAVGRAAVATALDMGARVTAAVRGSQAAEARSLGVEDVLSLDDERALAASHRYDVVANTVRGAAADRLFELVEDGGTFASATGAPSNADQRPAVRVVNFVSKQNQETLQYVAHSVAAGRLTIPIAERFHLIDAGKAHERLAGGGGKLLLLP